MKIIKEILISAEKDAIWQWLTDKKKNRLVHSSPSSTENHAKDLEISISHDCWKIAESDPPNSITLISSDSRFPLVTSYILTIKGKKTALKVVVEGWEKLSIDLAKKQMPKLSLEWEKCLSRIKKLAESTSPSKTNR